MNEGRNEYPYIHMEVAKSISSRDYLYYFNSLFSLEISSPVEETISRAIVS